MEPSIMLGKRTGENVDDDLKQFGEVIVYPYEKYIYDDDMRIVGYEIEYYFSPLSEEPDDKLYLGEYWLSDLVLRYHNLYDHYVTYRIEREKKAQERKRTIAMSAPTPELCIEFEEKVAQLTALLKSKTFSTTDFHGPIGKCNPDKRWLIVIYADDTIVNVSCAMRLLSPIEDQVLQCIKEGIPASKLKVSYVLLDKDFAENTRIALLIKSKSFNGKVPLGSPFFVTRDNFNKYMKLAYGFTLKMTHAFLDRHLELNVYNKVGREIYSKAEIAIAMHQDQLCKQK